MLLPIWLHHMAHSGTSVGGGGMEAGRRGRQAKSLGPGKALAASSGSWTVALEGARLSCSARPVTPCTVEKPSFPLPLDPAPALPLQGLCQLFELYFVSIFRLFGNKDALLSFRLGPSDSMFMPGKLHTPYPSCPCCTI